MFLWTPSSRAITLRDRPLRLACCTFSQSALWRAVGIRCCFACFQCRQVWVPAVSGAIDAAGLSGVSRKSRRTFPQLGRAWSCLLRGDSLSLMLHQELAVEVLLDLDLYAGVSRTSSARQQLQGAPFVLDGVVPGHFPSMFEAQDPVQRH